MVHHFLKRTPPSPDFPCRADLPHLSYIQAHAALDLLRLLVRRGDVEIYTAFGTTHSEHPLWNVWEVKAQRRIELERWAFIALCVDPDGGDAA